METIETYLTSAFHRYAVTLTGTNGSSEIIHVTAWVKMENRGNLLEPFLDGFTRVEISHIRQDAPDKDGQLYLKANIRITI